MTHAAREAGAASVRTFVALDLDQPARAAVDEATAELRRAFGGTVRWMGADTLHLTLRFLGDVAPEPLVALGAALDAATSRSAPVDLRLAGAGAFPPRGRPRVLWVGVEPAPALVALHHAVEDACATAGLGRDGRPFRPPLTVARPRPGAPLADPALAAALGRVGFVTATRVASLHLMRSDLTPAGARHTPLGTYVIGTPRLGARRAPGGRAPASPGAR